ncbi:B3 domain-containing protein REM17-like [Ipomoea triloba]|uniref:B3 domain-containing protein REM17-like n=1 Tax=Ipomoea triloba TaxID=35885 RepID=UPI00125E1EE0|nr:B3 domain-containing protein REM17-like [Ipomoea triloba]
MKTIPPKNPHFFKPIHEGFKNGVNIPTAFLAKYLKGQGPKFAILRRGDRSWRVKISGGRIIADGWEKFGAENGLNVGDFVVFRKEGDRVFDVSVFEPSLCERDWPLPHGGCPVTQPSNNFCSAARDTTSTSPADHPYFVSTIKSYCLKRQELYLPMEFAMSNGLVAEEKREMILRDDKERSWSVVMGRVGNNFSLRQGWQSFQMANDLKEGDAYKFELIKSGKTPIAKFHSLGTTSSSSAENPHFVATIKPYCLRKSHLNLPLEFARSNGLMAEGKREMILRDDKERSWPVVLGTMGKHVSLLRGWQAFRMAKGLKEGDAYKFELIKSGKKPIAKFHSGHFSGEEDSMKTIPPKNPHFIKPIHQAFKNGVDIPTAFLAKYLKGQGPKFAILRRGDRSWRVKIGGARILADGWEKFAAENGLNVGDVVVFRQERDTVFDVSVFEPSLCERDCPVPQPSKKFRSAGMVEPIARDTTSTPPADHPYFVSTIKSYCLRKSHLYLPLVFARSNGLVAKGKREMILIDDKERSWSVVLGREANHFSLQHGWESFQMANGLKEGDVYKFELIKSGEKPIAKFHSLGTTSSSSAENPHFVATIKPYCLRKSQLYLPLEFARSNGLMAEEKREMILRDDKERSWPVVLGTMGRHVSLLRGWQAFRMAKGLKEGDAYKFELIKSGKKPIAKFHCHSSGEED